MANRIEEAFNDCFERLSLGESLDSCLRSYPEHAMELDFMLRIAFDVKRRVYPIQPRPEFKYWSRVRLQGVQDYTSRHVAPEKASPFNFRRNLAISVAGLLVLVIASSGTVAASNDALPDQPLYGFKMAVEQAQLTLTVSDVDKAELYANLAEKRAHEIEAMARQGKSDYLISTAARMDDQLDQAETYISKYQAATAAGSPTTTEALPAGSSTTETTDQPTQAAPAPSTTWVKPPFIPPDGKPEDLPAGTTTTDTTDQPVQTAPATTTQVKPPLIASDNESSAGQTTVKRPLPIPLRAANINRAKTALTSSTAKSLATLQNALEKAPESARPAIIKSIERAKKANEWSQRNSNEDVKDQKQDAKPEIITPKPNTFPVKPLPDTKNLKRDDNGNFAAPDKPKYTPPWNNNLTNPTMDTTKTSNTGTSQAPVTTNTTNTATSQGTSEGDGDSSTMKATVIKDAVNKVTAPGVLGSSGNSSTINMFSK